MSMPFLLPLPDSPECERPILPLLLAWIFLLQSAFRLRPKRESGRGESGGLERYCGRVVTKLVPGSLVSTNHPSPCGCMLSIVAEFLVIPSRTQRYLLAQRVAYHLVQYDAFTLPVHRGCGIAAFLSLFVASSFSHSQIWLP